jgi:hypothetical protein
MLPSSLLSEACEEHYVTHISQMEAAEKRGSRENMLEKGSMHVLSATIDKREHACYPFQEVEKVGMTHTSLHAYVWTT